MGFFEHRNTQLAFYDTPGYVTHENALSHDMKALRNVGLTATSKADVILLCVSAANTKLSGKQQDWFADMAKVAYENAKTEVILVLNKVDLVEPKIQLLDTTNQLVSLINGVKLGLDRADEAQLDTTTFMISALKNDGVNDLKNYLLTLAKNKPHISPVMTDSTSQELFDDNEYTSLTPEQLVEESLLQVMLQQTHEEIPYIANITCTKIKREIDTSGRNYMTTANDSAANNESKLIIDTIIEVDTSKQQRIVIGQGGRTLVKIRQAACALLEKSFKVNSVILRCNVTTRFDNKGKVKVGSSLNE